MNYVSRITADHWSAKNKLEAAAKLVAICNDRRFITADKRESFISDFKQAIDYLNKSHPKCKELHLSVWYPGMEGRDQKVTFITISGVFQMELFEVTEYQV
jgi:hypothetical protein